MSTPFDTPPNGDFVRYLEKLTTPSPGAVVRGKLIETVTQKIAPVLMGVQSGERPVFNSVASRQAEVATRAGGNAHRTSNMNSRGNAANAGDGNRNMNRNAINNDEQGPPDLSQVLKHLMGQFKGDMNKRPGNR